jgi:hypothetical protein
MWFVILFFQIPFPLFDLEEQKKKSTLMEKNGIALEMELFF